MDKNERWTKIAKGVMGKTKKECVQRFKEIRNAIKEAQKS
jgi:DnaJ homolog subfamily C member 2